MTINFMLIITSSVAIMFILFCRTFFMKYISRELIYNLWKFIVIQFFPIIIPISCHFLCYTSERGAVLLKNRQVGYINIGYFLIMVLLLLGGIFNYIMTCMELRKLEQSIIPNEVEQCRRVLSNYYKSKKFQIVVTSRLSQPFSFGVFRKKIIIPHSCMVDKQYLECILLHEMVHSQRNDCLWKILAFIVCCVYWFNPLCWILFCVMDEDCELSCDNIAIQYMGEDKRNIYLDTLLSIPTVNKKSAHFMSAMGRNLNIIKRRMRNIMMNKKKNAVIRNVILGLIVAVCIIGHLKFESKGAVASTVGASTLKDATTECQDMTVTNPYDTITKTEYNIPKNSNITTYETEDASSTIITKTEYDTPRNK